MKIKPAIKEKADDEVRDVGIILSIARNLNIVPDQKKTLIVTGSKGKGTTTRLAEAFIRNSNPNDKVAMLVSPEEIDHNDRIRINNIPISKKQFSDVYTHLLPHLETAIKSFSANEYLSPSGLFMLIALIWFKDNGVDWFVLETGRGAKFDETGNLSSKVCIVTSILLEHPEYLGGSLESIAEHKVFACKNAHHCVVGATTMPYLKDKVLKGKVLKLHSMDSISTFPNWYNENLSLALTGAGALCGINCDDMLHAFLQADAHTSASFGYKKTPTQDLYYDITIVNSSLDLDFLKSIVRKKETVFVVSLPDEKDIHQLVDTLSALGKIYHIPLTGTRGYLSYEITNVKYSDAILYSGQYDDVRGFTDAIKNIDAPSIYLLGTNTFIRLAKKALFDY